jgi:hypothetical protein
MSSLCLVPTSARAVAVDAMAPIGLWCMAAPGRRTGGLPQTNGRRACE